MTAQHIDLNVAADFSPIPGPRKKIEGEYSGELFLEQCLRPQYQAAVRDNVKLRINLDGAEGYPTSFLEEAFGGLAREFGPERVSAVIDLQCEYEPYLAEDIQRYIHDVKIRP
jgi:hypothetical protein